MALIDLALPAVEPVDLAYVKTFLRVDGAQEDALIGTLIKTSRHQVENMIGRTLIRRNFVYRGPAPSGHCLSLPRPPLLSVARVSLIGENDQAVDIPTQDYTVNTRQEPGELRLKNLANWSDYMSAFCTIEIEFSAGYGDNADDVPLPIRQAILLLIAQSFECREAEKSPSVPMMVDALLSPYRWVRL